MMTDRCGVWIKVMDKYRVSLHKLDEQVAQAEAVMKGFLAELGYE